VGFAIDGGAADTAAEAVLQYVAATRATDPIARYVSRSTKWTIMHDSRGDAETVSAPNAELHMTRLPNGWIVDSGSYDTSGHQREPFSSALRIEGRVWLRGEG
jgi:hypothetical protein